MSIFNKLINWFKSTEIELTKKQRKQLLYILSSILNNYIIHNELTDPKDLLEIEIKNEPINFTILGDVNTIFTFLLGKEKIRTSYWGYYVITAFKINNDNTMTINFLKVD